MKHKLFLIILIYFALFFTFLTNLGCDETLLGLPPIYTDYLRNDPNDVLNVFPNKTLRDAVFKQLMSGKPDSIVLKMDDLKHLSLPCNK